MKNFFRAGGVLLIVAALALAGRSWSQTKPEPQPPRSRVALVNLSHLVKKYDKATAFQNELKAALVPFQKKDTELKAQVEKLQKLLKDEELLKDEGDTPAKQRDQIEKRITALEREIEDNQKRAKKWLEEKGDAQLIVLYRDIREAATRYAKAHDIELVLHFNDATTDADFWDPRNVSRKMQAGACMPLYVVPGMDISNEVLEILHEKKHGNGEASEPGKP
jgi:Skp family chaperone for outer membrane proteins